MIKQFFVFIVMLYSTLSLAQTTYVYNVSKNEVVLDESSSQVRPIASITKLMTAIVVLDSGVSLNEKITTKGVLFFNKKATREELMQLMLVKSDNHASESLANAHPGGRTEFIASMNRKADFLGMRDSQFDDASGLSAHNISTAKDLTLLLTYAFSSDTMRRLSSISNYKIEVAGKKTKVFGVNNTNHKLLDLFHDEIIISKTGTTSKAGKCLALFVLKGEEKYAIIFLGYKDRKIIEERTKEILLKKI